MNEDFYELEDELDNENAEAFMHSVGIAVTAGMLFVTVDKEGEPVYTPTPRCVRMAGELGLSLESTESIVGGMLQKIHLQVLNDRDERDARIKQTH